MGTSKRHHYVPQFILRNFTKQKKKFYCYDRERGRIFETTPKRVCVENNLNTDIRNGSDRLESDLSGIESRASDLARRILKMVREQRKLELSSEERKTWAEFTWVQFNRHPDVRDELRNRNSNINTLREIEREMGRPAWPHEVREFCDQEKNREVSDATFRDTVMTKDNKFDELYWPNMKDKSIGAIVLEDGAGEFVIGSQPLIVVPSDSGETGVAFPGVKLLYPISYDVVVGYDLPKGKGKVQVFSSYDQVPNWNELSLRQSEMIMGRSEAIVRTLAKKG